MFERYEYGNAQLRVHQDELRKIAGRYDLLAVLWLSLSLPLFVASATFWIRFTVHFWTTQVWVLAITAVLCTLPGLIASFFFRKLSGWWPFMQITTGCYLLTAFSLNALFRSTDFTYLNIPFSVLLTVSIFFTDYRVATKIFEAILVAQLILISLKLDSRVSLTWDIVLFPVSAMYCVSLPLIVGAAVLRLDGPGDDADGDVHCAA